MADRTRIEGLESPGVAPVPRVARGLFGRRRSFVVNRRYQLRAGLLTATVVLVLLVFLNLLLHALGARAGAAVLADAPELEPLIRAQDRVELYLVALASLVFLVGCFLVTVLETHRTAGAAHNLAQRLAEVERGRYGARLRLRRGDHLTELEPAFNRMVHALRSRVEEDVAALEGVAHELERGAHAPHDAAAALRELAARRRALLD